MPGISAGDDTSWYLEGFVDSGRRAWRTVIRSLPISIGRDSGMDLHLLSNKVSHRHAEIFFDGGLRLRDLGSTNGSFVNGRRIEGPTPLRIGDVIRFGDLEFRLSAYHTTESLMETTRELSPAERSHYIGEQQQAFLRLLETRAVQPLFQPVVNLQSLSVMGYELLGRGRQDQLDSAPAELFSIAERLDREVELSEIFRECGAEAATRLPGAQRLFINTHPSELRNVRDFLASVESLRDRAPAVSLVVEIHEAAMTEVAAMRKIRDALSALDVEFAFDDFGVGRSRLQAISEVPPDYLKFDLAFVRGLDQAPARRRTMVRHLIELSRSMGTLPIAEGIETQAELEACREAGFEWAQGFLFGEPSLDGATAKADR